MDGILVFLSCYFLVFIFLVYVLICGNNKLHRNGIIGQVFRFITSSLPSCFKRIVSVIMPKKCLKKDDNELIGNNGPLKYAVAIFFYAIYCFFALSYLVNGYPSISECFSNPKFHKFFAIFVLPWPWVLFLIIFLIDPGVIDEKNVLSYLKAYPYDNVLYTEKMCPTLNIPIVPRSRYCRYTNRRIAYVFSWLAQEI